MQISANGTRASCSLLAECSLLEEQLVPLRVQQQRLSTGLSCCFKFRWAPAWARLLHPPSLCMATPVLRGKQAYSYPCNPLPDSFAQCASSPASNRLSGGRHIWDLRYGIHWCGASSSQNHQVEYPCQPAVSEVLGRTTGQRRVPGNFVESMPARRSFRVPTVGHAWSTPGSD